MDSQPQSCEKYSCSKNFIQIKLDGGDENLSIIKLYLQVTIKDLYDEMIKPPSLCGLDEDMDNYGNFIISEYKFC